MFVRTILGFHSHSQSKRKFLVQGTFKIQTKQNKTKNVPLLSGVLLTQTFTKNTPEKHVEKSVAKAYENEDKKLQTHYSFTEKKQAFTHIKTHTYAIS